MFCIFLVFLGLLYPLNSNMELQNQDFLKGVLSTAIGGIIGVIGNFIITLLNNEKAAHRQRIDFDLQMGKMRYEEQVKACCAFLDSTSPYRLACNNFDINKVLELQSLLYITCNSTYSFYVKNIIQILTNNASRLYRENMPEDKKSAEYKTRFSDMKKYAKFYSVLVLATHIMLHHEPLIPSIQWDLDDYEKSIPLDYQQRLT